MLVFHFSSLLPDSSSSQLTAAAVQRCCRPPAAPLPPRSRVTRASPRKTPKQNMTAKWSGIFFLFFFSLSFLSRKSFCRFLSANCELCKEQTREETFLFFFYSFFFFLLLSWLSHRFQQLHSQSADGYSVSVSRGVKAGFSQRNFHFQTGKSNFAATCCSFSADFLHLQGSWKKVMLNPQTLRRHDRFFFFR